MYIIEALDGVVKNANNKIHNILRLLAKVRHKSIARKNETLNSYHKKSWFIAVVASKPKKMRLKCVFLLYPSTGSIFAFANNKLKISRYVTENSTAQNLNDGTNEPMNILIDCYLLLKKKSNI